jgi:hypothetical protein
VTQYNIWDFADKGASGVRRYGVRSLGMTVLTLAGTVVAACGSTTVGAEDAGIASPTAMTGATTTAPTPDANVAATYDPGNFSEPTTIDNPWLPLTPGIQLTYEGETVEDDERLSHQVIFTVTDLTKVIDGVRTVVVWDRDYSDGELVEAELAFFAQDDAGNVWLFGEYPEEYEDGELADAPAWIVGQEGAEAGIAMLADPQPGTADYAQGLAPEVEFTDRGKVHETGQRVCVPVDCYTDVVVIDETSADEPDAHQYKYYARGVGNISVGFGGEDASQETLELIESTQLDVAGLAKVRHEALELEKSAYATSTEVYAQTQPAE